MFLCMAAEKLAKMTTITLYQRPVAVLFVRVWRTVGMLCVITDPVNICVKGAGVPTVNMWAATVPPVSRTIMIHVVSTPHGQLLSRLNVLVNASGKRLFSAIFTVARTVHQMPGTSMG